MSIWKHIKAKGLSYILSKKKRDAYILAQKENADGILLKPEDVDSYCEQYMYRKLRCPECVTAGLCVECKCKTLESMRTRDVACSRGKWFEMAPPDEWEQIKKYFNIKFKLE